MFGRQVVTAQREAAQYGAAPQTTAAEVTWAELGCPTEAGLYPSIRLSDARRAVSVRVKRMHILVAEDNPFALFTVVTFRPPLGSPEFVLGHRIA